MAVPTWDDAGEEKYTEKQAIYEEFALRNYLYSLIWSNKPLHYFDIYSFYIPALGPVDS